MVLHDMKLLRYTYLLFALVLSFGLASFDTLAQEETDLQVEITWDQSKTELINTTDTIDSDSWYIRFGSDGLVSKIGEGTANLVIEESGGGSSFTPCTFTAPSFSIDYPSCATGSQDQPQLSGGDSLFVAGNQYLVYFTDESGEMINNTEQGGGPYPYLLPEIPEAELAPGLVTTQQTIIPHPSVDGDYYEIQVFIAETIPDQTLEFTLRSTSSGDAIETPLGTVLIVEGEQVLPAGVPDEPLPPGSYELVITHNESAYQVIPLSPAIVGANEGGQNTPGTGSTTGAALNSVQIDIVNNGLVPDCGYNIKTLSRPGGTGRMCGLSDLITLIQRVIEYIFILILPIAAIVFVYVGFLYLTSGGNKDKRTKAKKAMTSLGIGILVILAAWLIVKSILSSLGVDTGIAEQFLDIDLGD